jgi:Domain of unknown function (DUF1707)
MMVDRRTLRVSDAERQAVADRLLVAMTEGRLDLDEYDRRLAEAYQAVRYEDLDRLLADLPTRRGARAVPRTAASVGMQQTASGIGVPSMPTALKVVWAAWLAVVSINVLVWSILGPASGEALHFWPMWLLVVGAPLPGVTAGAVVARRSR